MLSTFARVLSVAALACAQPVTLYLGATLPLTGQIAIPGRGFQRALGIAISHLNADLAAPAAYQFAAMPICDDQTSAQLGADCALQFADFCGTRGYRPIGLLGSGFSSVTLQMAPITTRFKLLQCSPLSSTTVLSSDATYPYFFRTAPADDKRAAAILGTARQFGWDRAVLIFVADGSYGTTNGQQIQSQASNFGISQDKLASFSLPTGFATSPQLPTLRTQLLQKVLSSQARVVIQICLLDDCNAIFKIAVAGGIIGPGWCWLGADAWANLATPAVLAQIDSGALGYSRSDLLGSIMVIAESITTTVTSRFLSSYQALYNTTSVEPFIYAGYDCVLALGLAVQQLLATNSSIQPADLQNPGQNSGIQWQLSRVAKNLQFQGAGGFVQFAKPGAVNAGDRVPRYAISVWQDQPGGATFVQQATYDENRSPVFLATGAFVFAGGGSSFSAAAPGCPAGKEPDNTSLVPGACRFCLPGNYKADTSSGTCSPCQAGFYCPSGSTRQSPCDPGTFSNASQGVCAPCAPGTSINTAASAACQACPAGFIQPAAGQLVCAACPQGTYQELQGQTACLSCPSSFTTVATGTVLRGGCGCGDGTYLDAPGNRCTPCPEGMLCVGFNTTPLVAPGYYLSDTASRSVAPLDVFKCATPGICPGQRNLTDPVCLGSRVGTNCGLCPPGSSLKNGSCQPCTSNDTALLPILIVLAVLCTFCLHYFLNHGKSKMDHIDAVSGVVGSLTVGVTIGFIQQLGTIGSMQLAYPESFKAMLDGLKVLLFDPSIARPSCAAQQTLANAYGIRVAVPAFFALTMLFWLLVSWPLHTVTKGRFPQLKTEEVASTVGLFAQSLYISVATSTLTVVDCYTNPNGKKTVRAFPFAECTGSEYFSMMPLFAAAVLFYMIGIFALLLYLIVVAPRKYTNPRFRTGVRFLVFKFRPGCWWFGLVLLLRSFLQAMVTIVFPNEEFAQFLAMFFITLSFLLAQLVVSPFVDAAINIMESIELLTLCAVLVIGSGVLAERPDRRGLDIALLTLTSTCFACLFLTFGIACRGILCKTRVVEEEKLYKGPVVEAFVKVCQLVAAEEPEKLKDALRASDYVDYWHFECVTRLVSLELFGMMPEKLRHQRLPLVTEEVVKLDRHTSHQRLAALVRSSTSLRLDGSALEGPVADPDLDNEENFKLDDDDLHEGEMMKPTKPTRQSRASKGKDSI